MNTCSRQGDVRCQRWFTWNGEQLRGFHYSCKPGQHCVVTKLRTYRPLWLKCVICGYSVRMKSRNYITFPHHIRWQCCIWVSPHNIPPPYQVAMLHMSITSQHSPPYQVAMLHTSITSQHSPTISGGNAAYEYHLTTFTTISGGNAAYEYHLT